MAEMGGKRTLSHRAENATSTYMRETLFVFKGTGVADGAANRRRGARHALVVFAAAASLDEAQATARSLSAGNGWTHVTFQRGAEVNVKPSELAEDYLRSALEGAIETGAAIISYDDEVLPDA